jgi:AcrR family transcriptional regulator
MSMEISEPSTRGRPRDRRADVAIAGAVRSLLVEVGYTNLTMEAIAARAGVGKATLYRRYASKAEVVFANIVHDSGVQAPDTGSLRGDLIELGQRIVNDLASPAAVAAVPGLLADLTGDAPLWDRFQTALTARERALIAEILRRARDRGELRDVIDVDLVHASLLGAVFTWLLILRLPPTDSLGERIGELVADGLRGAAS